MVQTALLVAGTQERYISETTTGSGQTVVEGATRTDSIAVSLWVGSVTSGSLTITVYTLTDEGKEVVLITFPEVTTGTAALLLRKSAVTMQRFRIVATYDDICEYEVYVRAITGSGESSAKIAGGLSFTTSKTIIPNTPAILVPLSLVDRDGMSILNSSPTTILYISEDTAKLPAQAYPIYPGQAFSMDVAAGVVIYAMAASGTCDIRIAEIGG